MRRGLLHLLGCVFACSSCNVESLLPNENGGSGSLKPSGSETDRQIGMTQAHNAIRAQVSASPPLPDLAWSADLADVAQKYAEHLSASCTLVHSGGPYGENLAFFGGQTATPSEVVNLWASEKSCWTFGAFMKTDSCSSACKGSGGCGHYTQLVWRKTNVVGCGVATCSDGQSEVWVCNYDPPGNFIDETPY